MKLSIGDLAIIRRFGFICINFPEDVFFFQSFLALSLPCFNYNYTDYMEIFKNTTQDPTGTALYRQWIYQTCSQFGYCRFILNMFVFYVQYFVVISSLIYSRNKTVD